MAVEQAQLALSALVVVHNEEADLPDCLVSLGFCDEILVVLDRCTDASRAIAERYGCRILEGAWPLEGDRRNEGIAACGGTWIFEVDADERVPPALAEEIRGAIETDGFDIYQIPMDNYVGGRLVRYGWGAQFGTGSKPSLFRKGVKRWGRERVHPKLTFAEDLRRGPRLQQHLLHHLAKDTSDLLRRLDSFSTSHAKDLLDSGKIDASWQYYRRFIFRFWKCFISRRGYREGAYGFLIAICAGLYPLLSYIKARHELE